MTGISIVNVHGVWIHHVGVSNGGVVHCGVLHGRVVRGWIDGMIVQIRHNREAVIRDIDSRVVGNGIHERICEGVIMPHIVEGLIERIVSEVARVNERVQLIEHGVVVISVHGGHYRYFLVCCSGKGGVKVELLESAVHTSIVLDGVVSEVVKVIHRAN